MTPPDARPQVVLDDPEASETEDLTEALTPDARREVLARLHERATRTLLQEA